MKPYIIIFAFILSLPAFAQKQEAWQDPAVNEVNRVAMHGDFTNKGEIRMSLHGRWNVTVSDYPKELGAAPTSIMIPGMWELQGIGEPMYSGGGFEWKMFWENNPPQLPDSANYAVTYDREWNIPATWKGRDVVLHIGSVTSCVEVYVNGKYVGYGEDSKLEQEFDITKFVKFGKANDIRMTVRRWCDGSYLEDQDFFRYKGFARDTYFAARQKARIEDVQVDATLNDDFSVGTVNLKVKTIGKVKWTAVVEDLSGLSSLSGLSGSKGSKGSSGLTVNNPRLWSAEQPNLYNVRITSDKGDDITIPVGFRKVEIRNSQLLVNGKPVLIKGVDRHELDPDGGYYVSRERMEEDVKLMKAWNINALRMSHYPNDSYMYELCDRYGIYVVSETNIESHGMGYGEKTLAKNPLFKLAHMERSKRHVASRRNHPSIIIWSMGNECGYGENFEQVYDWLKVEDPTRPVQFEQAYVKERCTDIYCPMYPSYEQMDKYLSDSTKTKPMIMCEYAHAMGNSDGEMDEYWDRIRKDPKAQGGFIWDMIDQACRIKDNESGGMGQKSYYGYDGDWKTTITDDHNFCVNGLFNPDRKPNPQAYEVRYYYQNIWTKLINADDTKCMLSVFNENFFTDLSGVQMKWALLKNGEVIETGTQSLNAAPQKTQDITLTHKAVSNDAEYLLNVDYMQCGNRIAYQQFTLTKPVNTLNTSTTLNAPETTIAFDETTGFLNKYQLNGVDILKPGAMLVPNFWRAPTDDDYGANLQKKMRAWLNPKLTLVSRTKTQNGYECTYTVDTLRCTLTLSYDVNTDGSLTVTQRLTADSDCVAPDMFRFGMQMQMPHEFETISYYGRGPWENYQNRRASAELGIYNQTVTEQFYPYVRPQENGTKTDIRWWKISNPQGIGVEIYGTQPLSMSALHYTIDQMDDGIDKNKMVLPSSHSELLKDAGCTNLCIDLIQQGHPCKDSWYAVPLDKYMVHAKNMEYTFTLKPYIK